jgi:hypothetical protein
MKTTQIHPIQAEFNLTDEVMVDVQKCLDWYDENLCDEDTSKEYNEMMYHLFQQYSGLNWYAVQDLELDDKWDFDRTPDLVIYTLSKGKFMSYDLIQFCVDLHNQILDYGLSWEEYQDLKISK